MAQRPVLIEKTPLAAAKARGFYTVGGWPTYQQLKDFISDKNDGAKIDARV
ncbi:hypothetical protein OKW98_25315 [Pseudomonas sp. KU26590]|uniref:hypothetical protein n=1 Tax=Pseudomonas sp. KU26590 TaxID=2991051 RepID=UPI00223DBDF8|nr:hypothetical protein [Pseudomonas sp. KU26590]UZJ59812.1 hypothetical protein OKW98_25315 [Pseudomonas sp. KU26590]